MQALDAANGAEIDKAIEEACDRFKSDNLTLRHARSSDQEKVRTFRANGVEDPRYNASSSTFNEKACRWDVPNFFALILEERTSTNCSGVVTFYLAYSTWDARVLYLDKLLLPKNASESNTMCAIRILSTLADVAVRIGCTRFTWQHRLPSPTFPAKLQPETLRGWLTLHQQILSKEINNSDECTSQWTPEADRAAIDNCLARLHRKEELSSSSFCLRLSTNDDLESIERLVHGLALFEKEPESVHVTNEHYRRDGFCEKQPPLFHCILLEHQSDGAGKTKPPYVCGMAFCYFGYSFGEGRFFYLEDLYIEEKYRGKKGGSMAMTAVVEIAKATGCVRCVWQALDWNTPALEFYGKLGASVQEGLLTTRFAGQELIDFVQQSR